MAQTSSEDTAADAVASLGPEAGLFAGADDALFGRALGTLGLNLARHPATVAAAGLGFAGAVLGGFAASGRRLVGLTADGPFGSPKDKRFVDPAWESNPAYYGLRQGFLAFERLLSDLVESSTVDETTRRKARFVLGLLTDAAAPTNFVATNPAVLKRAFETGGASLVRGGRTFVDDLVHNRGRPRQVDTTPFELGRNLAATPGKVVFRNHLMELIQYDAQTDKVHEVPILVSPPWINKYYIMDLAPERSLLEWAVQHGHTVFAISYRNPDASMRDTQLDDYLVHGPQVALDVVQNITKAPKVDLMALCLGGALAAMLAAYEAVDGEDRIGAITLLNTMLDYSEPGELGAFTDEKAIVKLEQKMQRDGYLDGKQMAGTFDMLRANDLIFNYVVNNWLMGDQPPAFDILAWNADSTRMPAAMHAFYLRSCYQRNELAEGDLELMGRRLSLGDVKSDVFYVGAETDHIVPWRSAFRGARQLPGDVTFVLTSSGHIAGVVNPPNPKSRHWTGSADEQDADRWREEATQHDKSWWESWAPWAAQRGGKMRKPPRTGSRKYKVLGDAPGAYVRGEVPPEIARNTA